MLWPRLCDLPVLLIEINKYNRIYITLCYAIFRFKIVSLWLSRLFLRKFCEMHLQQVFV